MKSENLFKKSSKYFPGGVNSPVRFYNPYPFFIRSGKGKKIFSVDGSSFVDYCLAYGPLILGHAPWEVKKSISEQLERGWIFGAPTEMELKYAEILSESTDMEMMRFANSGTEATMHAIRLGRSFTGRKKIVKMMGGYHGAHDYVLVSPGSGAIGIPSSPGIPEESARNTLLAEFNNFESVEKIFRENGNDIALLIVEPVMGNIGVIPPSDGYIKFLREITDSYDSLLVMDEVITGFRLRFGTASQLYGVKPDLLILGKIVGGGLPFAVFGGRRDIMEKLAPSGNVYQAGTFSGNPLSVVAGIATVKTLMKKDYGIFNRYLRSLEKYLKDSSEDFSENITLNRAGGMFQIFFSSSVSNASDAMRSDSSKFFSLFNYLLAKGIYIPPSQFESLFISFKHTSSDLEDLGRSVYDFVWENKNRNKG